MRKTIAIFIMVIGSILFLFCGCIFLSYMRPVEHIEARLERQGIDSDKLYKDGIEQHVKKGRVITGILTLMSAGIIIGGYSMNKKRG